LGNRSWRKRRLDLYAGYALQSYERGTSISIIWASRFAA
jgi:hypothetical protein